MSDETETPDQPDESCGATIVRLAARYGLTLAECVEFIDEVGERIPMDSGSTKEVRMVVSKCKEAFVILRLYQSGQSNPTDIQMSTCAMAMVLGFYRAAGASCPSDLAKKMKMRKQTVSMCCNTFIKELRLPKAPWQRSDEGCKNMANAQNKMIKEQHEQRTNIP